MIFEKGTFIIDRQRWETIDGGKKIRNTFTTCVLLSKEWDSKSNTPIPYINYWDIDYKPRSKKFLKLSSLCRKWDDLHGGTLYQNGCWFVAPKKIIEICQKDLEKIKQT